MPPVDRIDSPTPRVISPLILADDFARQLSFESLGATATAAMSERRIVVCSVLPDGMDAVRRELGETRSDALMRELALFVRRNLRGTDAVAAVGDELAVFLDAPGAMGQAVAHRLLAATRAHVFSGGASDRSLRLTVSIGMAATPEHGASFESVLGAARAARASAGRDGVALALSGRPNVLEVGRFVGRTEQLGRLIDYLDDMVRGVGRIVAVIGETGVGTSALVRTLEPEVRMRGGSLVVASARESTLASPYALWCDVLRGVRRLPVKSTRGWRELPSLDPSLERLIDDPPRGRSKIQLLGELADFLRLAAQQRPLMLHLEELQWVDAASWDALEYLIPQLESERVLISLSFRTGEAYDDAAERWARLVTRPRHHEMLLTRLTRDDVKRWIEASMRGEEVGRDVLAYAYRQTEGNPLLLTHLLRDLEESGHLVLDGTDRWRWSAAADLPPQASLHELLARRINRLPTYARAVLEAAAVLGRECDDDLVTEMTELDPHDVADGLARLAAMELLIPTFERVRGGLVFAHDEVARVTRALLTDDRRIALHLRAARALDKRRTIAPSEIASHFEAAGAGPEAHAYAIRAADSALALYETAAAAALLASAERTAPSPEALAVVRVRMASLAEIAGRFEEAEALCEQALEWFERQGNQLETLRVKRTRTLVRMKRGQSASDTLAALLALEEEARRVGAAPERAAILQLVSQTHWRLGDPVEARRVAEESLAIAEQMGDAVLIADACIRLAVTVQFEDSSAARALQNRALQISTELGEIPRRVRCLINLGVLELIENNWEPARAALRSAAQEARTAGLTELWGRAELNYGVLAARVGEYDVAAEHLGNSLQHFSDVQHSELQLYAAYNLATLEFDRGRHREAGDTYELVMALAERIGQKEVQEGARAGFALTLLSSGQEAEARAAAERVRAFMDSRPDWFQQRELGEALMLRLLLIDGRVEEARSVFSRALQMADPTDIYAAAWLTAECGRDLLPYAAEVVEDAAHRYGSRPEVLGNPKIRDRFTVLLFDGKSTIDRS
ncbi:MAG TPA: AAA family ATPase [Gemmatimonadaceae bacterium]